MKYTWKTTFFLGIFMLMMMPQQATGQHFFSIGILPKINLSAKFSPKIKWVNSVESRQSFYESPTIFKPNKFTYDYILTDVTSLLSIKTGAATGINGGLMVRYRNGDIFLRFIQQFTLVNNLNAGRIGHRFAADQTLAKDRLPTYRLRYRITLEKPLNGERVDAKEWYVKINHEYLGSLQENHADLEIRLVPLLGYEISRRNKVEVGIDYRLKNLPYQFLESEFWLSATWYVTLGG